MKANRSLLHRCFAVLCFSASLTLASPAIAAENPFAAGVRPTDPQSPSEQQRAFRLPPGFEIELVASEPDIAKPMNLAFDVKGRLWVSDSYEYPFAAPLDRPGKDAIKILEDRNHDGRYDSVSTFVDGLNIPIGLYPYRNGVVAWSIPNLWYFQDTDGDGKADKRTKLYGPLGYERDTHGMNSSFTRGFDGWLYITHGFNNNTTVRGADGSEITMNSGNTYRVRLDGSRVEQFTYGQVNPFGMALDPLGNLYTSDCHSMPAYLLIRDAYYPSFGKPHDGLGFCPTIMDHSHGSTAIDGVVYYADNQWPAQYRDNIFIGNVMTSRVNRDTLIEVGGGKRAREEEDFIQSEDPWFRPVNMQFGPDGSLYIADFYNRIIGHYEVPLQHPGRDRHRGRIWKVSYRGQTGSRSQAHPPFDLTQLSLTGLFEELKSANLVRRQLTMNYLIDEIGEPALGPAQEILWGNQASNWQQRTHALWILHRLQALPDALLAWSAKDASREVRVHTLRVLAEKTPWNENQHQLAITGLSDADLNVRRAAADALTTHEHASHVSPLIQALSATPAPAVHLRHSLRIALRNQLRNEKTLNQLTKQQLAREPAAAIADVAIAIPSPASAAFLTNLLAQGNQAPNTARRFAEHIATYGRQESIEKLPRLVESTFGNNLPQQLAIYEAIETGHQKRNQQLPSPVQQWGMDLGEKLLNQSGDPASRWSHSAVPGLPTSRIPWILQSRQSADGDNESQFLCSLPPGGEQFTGILRSPNFTLPARFQFYLAGHDGYPDKAPQGKNFVRLRLAGNNTIIATARPPRNDTAQIRTWNLDAHAGQKAYLEIVDGDTGDAYAWLAAGRFPEQTLQLPALSPQRQNQLLTSVASIAAKYPNAALYQRMVTHVTADKISPSTRADIASALTAASKFPLTRPIARRLNDSALSADQSKVFAAALFAKDLPARGQNLVADIMRLLPARSQASFVQDLVVNREGARLILELIDKGSITAGLASPKAIQDQIRRHGPNLSLRLEQLIQNSGSQDSTTKNVIPELTQTVVSLTGDVANGATLFGQACQICHQFRGQGALVGPQLDGIGNRGTERLLEDILDPNRNVDTAFHTRQIRLRNGDAISGLFRRDEGNLKVYVNSAGQEFSLSTAEVAEESTHPRSLMPDNFSELLSAQQLSDLVTFLLSSGE